VASVIFEWFRFFQVFVCICFLVLCVSKKSRFTLAETRQVGGLPSWRVLKGSFGKSAVFAVRDFCACVLVVIVPGVLVVSGLFQRY
jgi:hypothetical protein